MEKATLQNIFSHFGITSIVSDDLLELAQTDTAAHYVAVLDISMIYIIDTDSTAAADGIYTGSVITVQL